MKYFILFQFIQAQFIFAYSSAYLQFQKYMAFNDGRMLSIEINSEQNGDSYNFFGKFYYLKGEYYIYDDENQRVIYNSDKITTINKTTKQVIFDSPANADFNFFDILTGQVDKIEFGEVILDKNGIRIPFLSKEWDLSGTLWTIPGSGKPKKLIFKSSENSQIIIKIISSDILKSEQIFEIDTFEYEIIDLSE